MARRPTGIERRPEGSDGVQLLLAEIIKEVVQLPEVCDVGEKEAGVGQILVHVVEIAQEHLAPVKKIVERLFGAAPFLVNFVEKEDEAQMIGSLFSAQLHEQVVYR